MVDSFLEIHDMIIERKDRFNPQLSGSTLTAVLITDDNTVFTAGSGDSHAVLIKYDHYLEKQI